MRPCTVNGDKYIFHCWEQYSQLFGESPMIGGTPAGQISQVFAIVENEDGKIHRANPIDVIFLDKIGAPRMVYTAVELNEKFIQSTKAFKKEVKDEPEL